MHTQEALFVTRAKDNIRFSLMYSNTVDKELGVRYDQIGNKKTPVKETLTKYDYKDVKEQNDKQSIIIGF